MTYKEWAVNPSRCKTNQRKWWAGSILHLLAALVLLPNPSSETPTSAATKYALSSKTQNTTKITKTTYKTYASNARSNTKNNYTACTASRSTSSFQTMGKSGLCAINAKGGSTRNALILAITAIIQIPTSTASGAGKSKWLPSVAGMATTGAISSKFPKGGKPRSACSTILASTGNSLQLN